MRLLRVGARALGGIEAEGLEEPKNPIRRHPTVWKNVIAIENADADELAQNPMEAHVKRRRRRVEMLTRSSECFIDPRRKETCHPI